MDAIRRREWLMFAGLKSMADEVAYRVFMLAHIPLYAVVVALLLSSHVRTLSYVIDVFLVAHLVVHLGFRRHPANAFNNAVSFGLILAGGLAGAVHLTLLLT